MDKGPLRVWVSLDTDGKPLCWYPGSRKPVMRASCGGSMEAWRAGPGLYRRAGMGLYLECAACQAKLLAAVALRESERRTLFDQK